MKKLKFNISKGFTLVECVIAIAVFAIMTSMVLMIMASTVKLSKQSSESEAGLNQLVQNVVQDSSNKAYGNDSNTLQMAFNGSSSANFSMTYSTVDGARNMIRCPSCGYEANSVEFIGYLYNDPVYTSLSDAEKKQYKISHWFNPAVSGRDKYVCPDCGATTTAASITLRCLSCENQGPATTFVYDDINGGYSCPAPTPGNLNCCGSGKVVQIDATSGLPINQDQVNTNYDFKISTIQSNAIRYSDIEEPTEDARKKELIQLSSASADGFNVNLTHTPSTIPKAVGVYKLTLSGFTHIMSGDTTKIVMLLPPGYVCNLLPTSDVDIDGHDVSGDVKATWTEPSDYTNNGSRSTLEVDNITDNGSYTIQFTLTNYRNNQDFEVDYKDNGGLMKFWYGASSNSLNYEKPSATPEPEGP